MFEIEAERPEHGPAIEALLDLSFGPGRYAKTAQRLREGNRPVPELCYVAFSGEGAERHMVGSLSFWPVTIGGVPAMIDEPARLRSSPTLPSPSRSKLSPRGATSIVDHIASVTLSGTTGGTFS